jgi:hypothetical protein
MRLIGLLGAFTARVRDRTRACRERTNACRETMVACRERAVARTDRTGEGDACKKKVGAFDRRTHAEEGRCMKEMMFVCRKTGWWHAG